jgi:hypothetical protein
MSSVFKSICFTPATDFNPMRGDQPLERRSAVVSEQESGFDTGASEISGISALPCSPKPIEPVTADRISGGVSIAVNFDHAF